MNGEGGSARLQHALASIERVRALHQRDYRSDSDETHGINAICSCGAGHFPCPTAAALDDPDSQPAPPHRDEQRGEVKPYAVEVQVITTVTIFPDATSPDEAERLVRGRWGELTRYDDRDLPFDFDDKNMTVARVRELD